jgi:hypothetical protein
MEFTRSDFQLAHCRKLTSESSLHGTCHSSARDKIITIQLFDLNLENHFSPDAAISSNHAINYCASQHLEWFTQRHVQAENRIVWLGVVLDQLGFHGASQDLRANYEVAAR